MGMNPPRRLSPVVRRAGPSSATNPLPGPEEELRTPIRPLPAFVACLAVGVATSPAVAQDVEMLGRMHGVRPPQGYYEVRARNPRAFEFDEDGVWRRLAREVRQRRRALLAAGDYATLNSHLRGGQVSSTQAAATGAAVTGTFRIPVLIGYFQDSTHAYHPSQSEIDSRLFSTAAAPPYSVTTFYDEMSNGLVEVTGDVIGWFKADSAAGWYEGRDNGTDPNTDHTGDFIKELLDAADPSVDFSQYDHDGDGEVDLIAVLHPLVGGECHTSHIWSHRWVYRAWHGTRHSTDDGVAVDDYIIQPAVGGSSGCDGTRVMAIGTFSHELGHGFGLPDLYDTGGGSAGIGVWGLMGSGSWNRPDSPAHMMAWSKDELGWIAVEPIDSSNSGARTLDPIVESKQAMRVELPAGSEYFLLETRTPLGSDINVHGSGLLVWHISPDLIASRRGFNGVNASWPHGVDLEQADGDDDLRYDRNRGDAGDPFPGSTSNETISSTSVPNTNLNDGSNSGVAITGITLNADGSVSFEVNYNQTDERVTTSVGDGTDVIVEGVRYAAPYDALWPYPSTVTISVDSIQGDTLTRHVFQSWSDGGARTHSVTVDATPDTFTANLDTEYRLRAVSGPGGGVTSSAGLDEDGMTWLMPGAAVQVVAAADPGYAFVSWSGDTTAITTTLGLSMVKPYTLEAVFGSPLAIQSDALDAGTMGAHYADTLTAAGGDGSFTWSRVGGDALPAGLVLEPTSGAIQGVLEESGNYRVIFEAVSGALTAEATVTLAVSRPSLLLDEVVGQLLGPVNPLDRDELRYLDMIGNQDGTFDIGDFRAYLQEQGLVADLAGDFLKDGADTGSEKGGGQ